MHTEFFEKTAILEEILSYKLATHSLTPKRLSNPKISDVFHATAGLLPLLKSTKQAKMKSTKANWKHDSKYSRGDYLCTRQKKSDRLGKNKV